MRTKFLAILILLILIGFPALIYWIFFIKNTSSVEIILGENISAHVTLRGTLSYSWLPLADKALIFEKKCDTSCIFSPIAPIEYTISISWEGFSQYEKNFTLENGEKKTLEITLEKTTSFEKISPPETNISPNDIGKNFENISLLSRDIDRVIWAYKIQDGNTQIGVIRNKNFFTLKNFPHIFEKISFSPTHQTFILYKNQDFAILADKNFREILETNIPENTKNASFFDNNWHIITENETLFYKNNSWRKNIRFTHWADFGNYRAGYIDEKNLEAKNLANYQETEGSILILLDRNTQETYEVGKNLKIDEIFSHEKNIIFRSKDEYFSLILP